MTILTIPEVARILRVTPKVVREQCASENIGLHDQILGNKPHNASF